MQDHINKFEQLQSEIDFQRPANINTLEKAEVNLILLRSISKKDEHLQNYHASLGDHAYQKKMAELFAEVKAIDKSRNETEAPETPQGLAATAPTPTNQNHQNKNTSGGSGGKKG